MELRENKHLVYPGGTFVTCHIYYLSILGSLAIRNNNKLSTVNNIRECFTIVPIADIQYLFSNGNYLEIHLKDTTRLLVVSALYPLQKVLPKMFFAQVHNAYIINKTCVPNKLRNIGKIGEKTITLTDGTIIPVMKRFVGYNYHEKQSVQEKIVEQGVKVSQQIWINADKEILVVKNVITGLLEKILLKKLLFIEAKEDYVSIVHEGNYTPPNTKQNGPIVLAKCTMHKLILMLQVYGFIRTHRSFIVRTECVCEKEGQRLYLQNDAGERLANAIPIGRVHRKLDLTESVWGLNLHTLS